MSNFSVVRHYRRHKSSLHYLKVSSYKFTRTTVHTWGIGEVVEQDRSSSEITIDRVKIGGESLRVYDSTILIKRKGTKKITPLSTRQDPVSSPEVSRQAGQWDCRQNKGTVQNYFSVCRGRVTGTVDFDVSVPPVHWSRLSSERFGYTFSFGR